MDGAQLPDGGSSMVRPSASRSSTRSPTRRFVLARCHRTPQLLALGRTESVVDEYFYTTIEYLSYLAV